MFRRKEGIGQIKSVPIRNAFAHEALDFTTWLEANIDLVSNCIGIELQKLTREKSIGNFRADLVCQDAQGNYVVIENQLEKSDHDHLGKIHTYMAGVKANTAIWITTNPRAEHIEAIKYLNESTRPEYEFYMVKVEAIQIDDSRPAPLFTLVVSPEEREEIAIEKALTNISIEEITEVVESPIVVSNSIVNLPPVWCVFPRRDIETYELFLKENIIGLGFSNIGDLRKIEPSFQAVKEKWQSKNWLSAEPQTKTFASIVHSFGNRAQVNDLVIYPPTWKERKIYVGQITGDYIYNNRQKFGYHDLRSVRWFAEFDREQFGKDGLRGIQVNLAFFQVRNEAFLTELANFLSH